LRRTTESTALAILRKLEEEGIKHRVGELSVTMPPAVAMYLLNQKRRSLVTIEGRYGMSVGVVGDPTLVPPDHRIERRKPVTRPEEEAIAAEEEAEVEAEAAGEEVAVAEHDDGGKRTRRRRPRRRRRGEDELQHLQEVEAEADAEAEAIKEAGEDVAAEEPEAEPEEGAEQPARKRRRRGKRGGRRRVRVASDEPVNAEALSLAAEEAGEDEEEEIADETEVAEDAPGSQERTEEQVAAAGQSDLMEATAGENTEAGLSPSRVRSRSWRRDLMAKAEEEGQSGLQGAVVDTDVATDSDAHAYADGTWAAGRDDQLSDEDAATAEADEIVVVGGTRPSIGEPDLTEPPSEPQGEPVQAADEMLPTRASLDEHEGRRASDDVDVVVVGEARPPLAESEVQEIHAPDHAAQSTSDEPQPGYAAGDTASARPVEERLASAEHAENEPAQSGSSTGEPHPLSEKARRTEVIRVGEGGDRGGEDGPRRGWWQRLLS
jgi:ribonuclease E